MRIIGGTHRATTLADVGKGDVEAHLRPTSDRVRESLFNVLMGGRYGNPIQDARVLDLCAGTGALGLEALSRGAAHVTFVDSGKAALKLIDANIKKLRRGADCAVLSVDVSRLPNAPTPCGLVFLDPPYGQGIGAKALSSAKSAGWIATNALVVWEENTAQIALPGFQALDQRRYGDTWVTLMRAV